jgi:hypothetical protein
VQSQITALEKQTWIDSVRTRTMKTLFYTKDSRIRASPRHCGQGVFFWIFSPRTATGAPLRGWRHSSYLGNHLIIFSIMYREDSNLSFVKTNINPSSSIENYEHCITWNCTAELRNVFLLLYHVSVNYIYTIIHGHAIQKRVSTFALTDRRKYVWYATDFVTIEL